jgi:selenocysteine lyase/cysteine desulfurase
MENHFSKFRDNIIGINHTIQTPYHKSIPILYADWTASGRLYNTIEEKLNNNIYPYVANTHTDTNDTAKITTKTYHKAKEIIKQFILLVFKNAILSVLGVRIITTKNEIKYQIPYIRSNLIISTI